MVVAHGAIEGHRAVCAAFEFAFIGGSMGAGVGEALVTAARLAVLQDSPLVVFTASGGARMQEGAISPDADAAHRHRHPHGEGGGAAATSWCCATPPPAA